MCEMVEVYAEDSFLGIYTLCDQVEVGKGRVNINKKIGDLPENTDYFIELDYRISYDDPKNGIEGINWFWMSYYNDCYEIKSPELDIDQTEYGDYIRNYIDETYEIILSKN